MGCIYRILNNINGKSYIGQYRLNNPSNRFNRHIRDSKTSKCVLHCSMRKYGIEAFSIEVLVSEKNVQELNNLECYYAEIYDSYIWINGYNMVECGKGRAPNFKHKEEHKLKLSIRQKGVARTKETIAKQSKTMTGRKLTPEHRQKISDSGKGKQTGCIHSLEQNSRVSTGLKKFYASFEGLEIMRKRSEFYASPEGKDFLEKRKEKFRLTIAKRKLKAETYNIKV